MTNGTMSNLREQDSETMEYKRLFEFFDKEKCGYIKLQAMQDLFLKLGVDIDIACMESDEVFDFDTVLRLIKSLAPETGSEEKYVMHCVFREFDNDQDGFITASDLRRLLLKVGEEISENDLQEMIKEADTDGDGKVSFNEFIQIVSRPSKKPGENSESDRTKIKEGAASTEYFIESPKRKSSDDTNRHFKLSPYRRRSRKGASPSRRTNYTLKFHKVASDITSWIVVKRIMRRNSWN